MVSNKKFCESGILEKKKVRGRKYNSLKERFWEKVLRTSNCWIWQGGKNSNGYGYIKFNRKQISAHRVSHLLKTGKMPGKMYVLHKCDNPSCVRPSHIYLGTNQDNMNDAKERGQIKSGAEHPLSKLTNNDVLKIRDMHIPWRLTYKQIARKFNVSISLVGKIVRKQLWK